MQRNLTPRYIESLKPKPGKRVAVFDTKVTGLCVRKTDTGHARFYVMSRGPKDANGKAQQVWAEVRDGNAPVTSLAKARELAPAGVANIKNGLEAFPRIEAPAEVETYDIIRDRFIEVWAKPRQRKWKETARLLKAVPWGRKPIASITATDAHSYLDGLVAAGKVPTAARTLSWLKTMFGWAYRKGYAPAPIMDRISADDLGAVGGSEARLYSDEEIKALWNATGDLTARERAFLKLSILLAPRASALAGMRKGELDSLDKPTAWTVPVERVKTTRKREREGKAKPYVYPLPPLARRVLLPLLKGDGELVFPSATRPKVPLSCTTPLNEKIRAASGIADWTHHQHRDTATTWLQKNGYDDADQKLFLKHATSTGATVNYAHGFAFERCRKVTEAWASHVASIVAAKGAELLA